MKKRARTDRPGVVTVLVACVLTGLCLMTMTVSCDNRLQGLIEEDVTEEQLRRFDLTIVSIGEGSTTPSGTIEVKEGQSIAITADPADGSAFESWGVVSGEGVVMEDDTAAETHIALSTEDATVEARFYQPDTTRPGVIITTGSDPVSAVPITISILFSEPVIGFEQSDLLVQNAQIFGFYTSDNVSFSLTLINPTADPVLITVTVPEDAASDPSGNGNTAGVLQLSYDTSVLTADMYSSATSPTNSDPIPLTIEFNQEIDDLEVSDLICSNCIASDLLTSDNTTYTVNLAPSVDGTVQVLLPANTAHSTTTDRGNLEAVFAIQFDGTAPNPPAVSGVTPTPVVRPEWTWTSGGGGIGTYRYKLDSNDFTSGAEETSATSYIPDADLGEGLHTLYVRERDVPGNWSESGSFDITIDTSRPGAPDVTGPALTQDRTPTWNWTSGGNGIGTYQYRVNGGVWSAETVQTQYTSPQVSDNAEITLVIDVQEKGANANWSDPPGTCTTVVDNLPPNAPDVGIAGTTPSPTENSTPTWVWQAGGGDGVDQFRYNLNDSAFPTSGDTSATSYAPSGALAEGTHTLYVWERDALSNWSDPGSHSIEVDFLPTGSFVLRDATDSNPSQTDDWEVSVDSSNVLDATEMRFRNSGGSYSSWITFSSSHLWNLSGGDGGKTVDAEYRDDQDNSFADSDSIVCRPSWDNTSHLDLANWPMTDSSITYSQPSSYLMSGDGFVLSYQDSSSSTLYYTKVQVTARASSSATLMVVQFNKYYWSSFGGWLQGYSATNQNWNCSPTIYVDLTDGSTSTTVQSDSDIRISFVDTIFDNYHVIECLHPEWSGAVAMWNNTVP